MLFAGRGRIGIYTDQELDSETGLYNYDARLYDPLIGRFISPDSIVPDLYDPQSLNRYSYCRNNPLRYTDPTGHYNNDMEHGGRAVGAQGRGGAGPGSGLGGDSAAGNDGGSESSDGSWFGGLWGDIVSAFKDFTNPDKNKDGYITNEEVMKKATIDGLLIILGIKTIDRRDEDSPSEGKPGTYAPDRSLPRDEYGNPIPDTKAPHTQLGKRTSKRTGETYTQGREFGDEGKHVKDIDFTDHGRKDHTNPHQHRIDPKTGKRMGPEPLEP